MVDLIITEMHWAKASKSEQQKRDIINLLETGYDKEYLIKWLRNIGILTFAKEFINAGYFSW